MDTVRIDLSRSTETKELEDEIEMTIIKTPKRKKGQIGYERFKGGKM